MSTLRKLLDFLLMRPGPEWGPSLHRNNWVMARRNPDGSVDYRDMTTAEDAEHQGLISW